MKTVYPLPIKGTISSGYGPRWGKQHNGIDIVVPDGTDVISIADGVVARSDMTNKKGYGNFMCVEHDNIKGSKKFSCYAHLTKRLKEVGNKVKKGQVIAKSGGGQGVELGGGFSTGPHLHFEIRNSLTGDFEDPKSYLDGVEITKPKKDKPNKKRTNTSSTLFGGGDKPQYIRGPKEHSLPGQSLGNWPSDHAWDLGGPIGTSVYSLTKGKVNKVHQSSGNNPKIFGTQVSISGTDGYPSIFYTHINEVKLKTGDVVDIGDFIGNIERWPASPETSHVHIGIDQNKDIYSFMDKSGKIKNYQGSESDDSDQDVEDNDETEDSPSIFASIPFDKLFTAFGKEFKSSWKKSKEEIEKEKKPVYEDIERIKDIMKKIL